MWVRPGWEAAVRTAGFSLGQDAVRWAPPLEVAAAHPFYRNVTTRGRHSWTYHEGSFYPMNELQAFRARLDAWLTAALQAAGLAPRPHAVVSPMEGCDQAPGRELRRDVLQAFPFPEEFWLQNYVLNEGRGGHLALPVRTRQLCLRDDARGETLLADGMRAR